MDIFPVPISADSEKYKKVFCSTLHEVSNLPVWHASALCLLIVAPSTGLIAEPYNGLVTLLPLETSIIYRSSKGLVQVW